MRYGIPNPQSKNKTNVCCKHKYAGAYLQLINVYINSLEVLRAPGTFHLKYGDYVVEYYVTNDLL